MFAHRVALGLPELFMTDPNDATRTVMDRERRQTVELVMDFPLFEGVWIKKKLRRTVTFALVDI